MTRPLLAAVLLCLAGCGDERPPPAKPLRPIAFRPEMLPDIPLPAGWRTVPDEDQLAWSIAGGGVRRLAASVTAPPARDDLQPDDAMARLVAGVLPQTGWQRLGDRARLRPTDLQQRWGKGDEVLSVAAEREGGLVVLRYALGPAAP